MGALCTMGLGTWGIALARETREIPWACGHEAATETQHLCLTGPDSRKCGAEPRRGGRLVRFAPLLLAQSLPRKRFFGPAFLARLHVKAVLLDFLDDVFLLHLALKSPQSVLQGLTLLDNNFSHLVISPPIRFGLVSCGASCRATCALLGRLFPALPTAFVGTAPVYKYLMPIAFAAKFHHFPNGRSGVFRWRLRRLMHLLINLSD